ncbi:MAG: flagellar protein FliT [Lachnospiraceae bacterium]
MQEKEYIAILSQSLEKKVELLDLIMEKNKEQRILFTDETTLPEDLEENMQEKSKLVEQLEQLDDGFEQTYDRVREVLSVNKSQYKEEITEMQNSIRAITEKMANIRTQEIRNRDLAAQRFSSVKKQIRQVRTSNKVASQYYKNMEKINVVDSQFVDHKK